MAYSSYTIDSDINQTTLQDNKIEDYLNLASAKFLRKYGKSNKSIKDFTLYQCLGKGNFGEVYLARESNITQLCAIKLLDKDKILKANLRTQVIGSRKLLSCVSCPFIIKLYNSFQDNTNVYLSLEYMPGNSISKIMYRSPFQFIEPTSLFCAAQVVLALGYLHNLNIIYRDLMPENILLCADGYLKLADSRIMKCVNDDLTKTFCGTPLYMAPEIYSGKGYGRSIDCFALGILLFHFNGGSIRFHSGDLEFKYKTFMLDIFDIFTDNFSEDLKSLISGLLHSDLTKRIRIKENGIYDIKRQPSFKDMNWVSLFNKKLPAPFYLRTLVEPELQTILPDDVPSKSFDEFDS